jgi:hypothetical protein
VELYPGDPCENNNQADKEKKGLYCGKICIFSRLVGTVYEKHNDEVYEIAKHRICYSLINNIKTGDTLEGSAGIVISA